MALRALDFYNHIFAVYKPKGLTSHDVVNQIRKITGEKRVGHAGALDPLAKGVLVVGIGRKATKKLSEIVKKEKEYLVTVRLGMESATDDEEGAKTKLVIVKKPTLHEIRAIIKKFQGQILQLPPAYSAVKIGGRPAYKLARQGRPVNLRPRRVVIKKIKILSYHWPYLKLKVVTGPGVYIRSLARDIGRGLKVGGYLYNLERTRVGNFTKKTALTLTQLKP